MLRIGFYLVLIFIAVIFSEGSNADSGVDQEFQVRKKIIENRYIDFRRHKVKAKIFNEQRLKGLEAYKAKKSIYKKRRSQARKKRVSERTQKFDTEGLRLKWERAKKEQIEKRILNQKLYVKKRDQLRAMEEGLMTMPAYEELNLPEGAVGN